MGLAKIDKLDRQIATTSRQKSSAAKAQKLKTLRNERKRVLHDYL
jgi:hypothetical protein